MPRLSPRGAPGRCPGPNPPLRGAALLGGPFSGGLGAAGERGRGQNSAVGARQHVERGREAPPPPPPFLSPPSFVVKCVLATKIPTREWK